MFFAPERRTSRSSMQSSCKGPLYRTLPTPCGMVLSNVVNADSDARLNRDQNT